MSQSERLEQEDIQNDQDSIQPDPLLASPAQTTINQLPLLQYRNGFFQGHIDQFSQRQGKGIYYWSSGEIYYGEWNQDRMEGEGIFYFAFGGYAYGTFLEDKVHGYAVLCFSNGDYIAGFWERGVLTGKVIQYSKQPDDWCLYDYKEGSPEKVVASGKGNPPINDFNMIESSHLQKLVNKDFDLFAAEKPEFEDEQANITFLPIGEQGWYHGLAQHETPQGLGIVCHLENKSDRGLFKESVLDGPGRSIFENGDVYDGFFKGGKFNGVGVYFKGQTEQYLYGVYENSECIQALTLGNGYPHELIRTLKGDFKLEESEYIDRDTDFEVLILSELSRAQSMAEGVDQREWMSISRNAHEESRDHSLPLESQRSKNNGSRNTLEQQVLNAEKSVSRKGTSEVGQIGSQKNVNSVKSVKSIKNTEEEEVVVVRRTDNVSNASSVKSNKGVRSVKEEVISQKQPSIQRVSASAHNSQTSVQSKGKQVQGQGSRVESRTSVHEDVIVQQNSKHSSKQRLPQNEEEYSSIESYNQNKKSEQKSRQAVSREVSGGSAHVSNVSEKKSQPQKTSSSKNRVSDQNASIGSHRFEEQRSIGQIQQDFINADNKRGGLRVSSPDVKTKFTEESPDRHIKSEVLEIHSARSGHSDRLNRKTHENINNEVHNIMDQIFRTDDSHLQTLQTEQSQGAIYYDLNGSFGSPVKPKKEHVLRSHLPERDHDDSRRSDHANSSRQNIVISHSSRAEIEEPELKVKTPINKTVEHSKAESYEEEQKDQVADQETMNNGQTLEKLLRQLGREVKSEVLDGALSNRSRLRRKTTEGYSEANQEQVIEEEIYRIMMSKIELLLREQTRTSEKVDEIKRIIETKLDPLLKNVNQGNQVLKKGLGEKVEILAREKDYDSNVDILRQMHQDLVHHTRLSNISLNITHTKLDTLLMAQDIQNPNIGNPELVLDPPYSQEMLSGQLFKSQYDKSPLEIRSAASTQEQPNSAMTAFLNQSHLRTTEHSYSKSTHQHNYKATPPQEAVLIKNHYQVEEKKQARQVPYQIPSMEFDETNYMSIASDSAPLKLVNTFTPNAKQLFSKNEHIFENLRTDEERVHDTPYQSKDSALSQSIIKFRNSIRQQTENNNPSDPGNQLSSRNYVLTQTPRDKITYLQTEESVSASRREPTLQSNKSSSKNNAPVTPERRAGRNNMDDSRISQASHRRPIEGNEADVSPDRYQPQGSSTPRPKESTGSNVKDKSRWNLGFCGQSEVIDEPEAFMGPKKFMKTSNVHQTEEDSRILQTNGQDTNRSHVSQSHLKVPSQNALRKSAVQPHSGHNSRDNYKPSSVKVVEQLVGGDRSHRERSDAPAYNGDMNVFNHFVVTSSNNRLHSPSPVSEYVRIDKGNASQRNMQSYNRGTQSASAKKYLGESNLRVREVNVYEEEGSQAYDRVNTRQNTMADENGTWRNSVGGGGSYEHSHQRVLTTGVSPIKIRREPMSAQNPLKNSVHEGRLGTVRWRLELEQVDDEFDNRTPQISQRNLVHEILGVDPNEDVREIPQHKVQASNKSSKLVSTIGGLLTSERNWEKPQIYIPQEQIHQEIYYVNEGDDPLSSRRSYKMSEQSRKNYPETKIVYPVQALENMGVMKTHPDDYIERQVNREVSTRKSGNSKKSSYNVIEDDDYEGQYQRENVQIRAWDQGLIDNLHRGQNQSNVKAVYKNYHQ